MEAEAIGNQLTHIRSDGRTSELIVEGLEGNFRLSWRQRESSSAQRRLVTTRTTIEVRIEDQLSVTSKASLDLQSTGGGLGSIDIQLPPNMEFQETGSPSGLTVKRIRALSQGGEPEVIRVTWDDPQVAQGRVEIGASLKGLVGQEPLEAIGFRVLEATQQTGSVTVLAADGWTARPELVQGLRRESVPETPGYMSWKYVFAGPANSLQVAVSQATQSVHIEPLYIVQVQGEQLKLEARFTCRLYGPPDASVTLEVPLAAGWVARRVSPESAEPPDLTASPLPLSIARSPDGSASVIRVFATRAFSAPGLVNLEFPPPEATGDGLEIKINRSPPRAVLAPADHLRLDPSLLDTGWLLEDGVVVAADQLGLPQLQQSPRFFSATADQPDALQAEVAVESGAVAVDAQSDVELSDQVATVEQTLDYTIAYQRIDQLLMEVDRRLLTADDLATVDAPGSPAGDEATAAAPRHSLGVYLRRGDHLENLPFGVVAHSGLPPGRAVIAVRLPELLIGAHQVVVRTFVPLNAAALGRGAFRLPLVLPVESESLRIRQHGLTVRSDDAHQAQLVGEQWARRNTGDDSVEHFVQVGDGREVSLRRGDREAPPQASMVDKVWVQSWLGGRQIGQRAVYRVETSQTRLEFEFTRQDVWSNFVRREAMARRKSLPGAPLATRAVSVGEQGDVATSDAPEASGLPDADRELGSADPRDVWQMDVAVNGERVEAELDPEAGRLAVPLSGTAGVHVVEIWRMYRRTGAATGRRQLAIPQLRNARGAARTFWQVVLPESQFLVGAPADMTADMRWSWNTGWPRRKAMMRQLELEAWIGATLQDSPPQAARVYLFSTLGAPPETEIWTISRSLLILLVAGALLAVGLLLLAFRPLRHPGSLLLLGVAMAAAAAAWPNLVLLSAEAVSIGCLLVAVAGIVRWLTRPVSRGVAQPDEPHAISVESGHAASPDETTITAPGAMLPLPEPR